MLATAVKQVGFSMIEVLITLVVVSIGFVSLTYLHLQISEESGVSFRQMESLNKAWAAMDDLRKLTSLSGYDSYATSGLAPYTYASETSGELSITKRILAVNTNPHYIIIEGTSTWTDSNGVSHTDKMRTAIPRVNPASEIWSWS